METSIMRRPRPMGLTALSLEYQKTPSDEGLTGIFTFLVNCWYANMGTICGVHYDMSTFAARFGIPKEFVSTLMMETVCRMPTFDQDKQQKVIEGLISEQILWAMEDRMEIVSQVNLLKASQNGKYTPFVSAELNKALKLRLESSGSLQQLVRSLTGSGGSINIFQQFNQQNTQVEEATYVTIDQAREIIQEQNQLEDKSSQVKYLEAHYDFSELPEVCATKQQGVDTSKEGLTLNKTEINAITDNYKDTLALSSKEHHEIRREIEERIDPDSPDPELEIYDEDPEETVEPIEFGKSEYLNN